MTVHITRFRAVVGAFILLMILSRAAAAQPEGPMIFREVTVSRAHIVFDYASSLWIADRSGGEARRLTNHSATEAMPVFSPDGAQVAFARRLGGNWDVYVMPVSGGEARRLTYHASLDLPQGWTADGKKILFSSYRNTRLGADSRVFAVPAEGGMPEQLSFQKAGMISASPDGSRFAYTAMPLPPKIFLWRNYRGGAASAIHIGSLSNGPSETVPRTDSNDFYPMWIGDLIYFISDRDGTYNLFSYDTRSKKINRLTRFEQYDIKWASACADSIALIQDGAIHLHDLKSGQTRKIIIRVSGDFAQTKPRTASLAGKVRGTDASLDGKQALVSARGELFIVNAETGEARNITQTAGVIERAAKWSPDGKWIAHLSDESGEYQLHIRPASGDGPVRKIMIEKRPSHYSELLWSPDSKKIALSSRGLALLCIDVERGASRMIDANRYAFGNGEFQPAWSSDSRWLAYSKLLPSRLRGVFVHSIETGKNHQVTDGRSDAANPAFDKNGKYLYFRASTNSGPLKYGMSSIPFESALTRSWFVVLLDKTALPPSTTPSNVTEEVSVVQIDFENINERIFPLPGARPATTTDSRPRLDEAMLKLEALNIQLDPRVEWRAIYKEAFRLMRDYFYDANLHGQNLARLEEHYAAYLANLVTREDLNELLKDAFWHLSVSHLGVNGGDSPPQESAAENLGLLGADYVIEKGRHKISRIYRGNNSSRLLQGPLAQPGVDVKEGEFLLAVDGQEISGAENLHRHFLGKANKQVKLKVASTPEGAGARIITVTPLADETALRQSDWVEANRRRVEQLSAGNLGYIYLPDTSRAGYDIFNRDFYSQLDKQGLIIDERYNGGGVSADYIIEALRRQPLFGVALRDAEAITVPMGAIVGPVVMVTNEYAASGGDSLPFMFKAAKLGLTVGRRTLGAGVGAANQELVDGGMLSVPDWGHFDHRSGALSTENRGVAPDVEVEISTSDWRAGRDPQIERAVQIALEEIKRNPPAQVKRPAYPTYK